MTRINKPPEIRRNEIIEAAFRLFYVRGYESTSFEDIANEINVVKGLIYRYFSSKQELLDVAMGRYVREFCIPHIKIIRAFNRPLKQRFMELMSLVEHGVEEKSPYYSFLHLKGNEVFHDQLSMQICRYLMPHVTEALTYAAEQGVIHTTSPAALASFLCFGQLALWQSASIPTSVQIKAFQSFMAKLLE